MNNFLKKYKNYIVFLILLFFLIGLKVINPSFIKSVSFLSFDLYQKIFPLKKQSSAVVLVDVDENNGRLKIIAGSNHWEWINSSRDLNLNMR